MLKFRGMLFCFIVMIFRIVAGFIRFYMKYETNANDRFKTWVDAFASF